MSDQFITAIAYKVTDCTSVNLKIAFHDYKYLFDLDSMEDVAYMAIRDFLGEEGPFISKDKLLLKCRSSCKSSARTRKLLFDSKNHKNNILCDEQALADWYYNKAQETDYPLLCRYPYFASLTDNKKKKYICSDIIDCFISIARSYNYCIDELFTYYPEEMATLPIFGPTKSAKGEKTSEITFAGNVVTVHDTFSDETYTYYCLRNEKGRPLGPTHSLIYNFILNRYLKTYVFSNPPQSQNGNVNTHDIVECTLSELATVLELNRFSQKRKEDTVGQILSDLALNTYARMDSQGNYATDVARLIGDYNTIPSNDGTSEVRYVIFFPPNLFVRQYTNITLLRTCNEDIKLLETASRILIPFLQKERIFLHDHNQTSKNYQIMFFGSHLRIPRRSKKAVLEALVPILEDCKKNHVFIKNYAVIEDKGIIMIDYIPLSKKEREIILISAGVA